MKRSMTLIETILAMTLFSLLFTTLFFWYTNFSKNPIDPPNLQKRYAIERLNTFFSRATINLEQGVTAFYSIDNSIVFTFENGPYEEPLLSDVVLARLYHDPKSETLCLTIWPQPKWANTRQDPSLTLPLLDNVKSLSFSFYEPPDPFAGPVSPKEIKGSAPSSGWQEEWKSEFGALPAIVKLSINKETYLFDFPHPIIYAKETS